MPSGLGLNMARASRELTKDVDTYSEWVTLLARFDGTAGTSTWTDFSNNNWTGSTVASGTYTPTLTSSQYIKGNTSVDFSSNNSPVSSQYAAVQFNVKTQTKSTSPQVLDVSRDFTVEGWIYFNGSLPTSDCYFFTSDSPNNWAYSASMNGFRVGKRGDHTLIWYFDNGSDVGGPSSGSGSVKFAAANTWYHWAVTKTGSTMRTYINGTASTTTSNVGTRTHSQAFAYLRIGTDVQKQGASMYLDDIRVTCGRARYGSSNFTVDRFSYWPVPQDIHWLKVVTLLKAENNTDDSSQQAMTWTAGSSLQYGTYFNGSFLTAGSNRYVTTSSSDNFNFGTGNFTIEMWANFADVSSGVEQNLIDFRSSTSSASPNIFIDTSNRLCYRTGTTTRIQGSVLTTTGSRHIAITRVSGTTTLWVDGVSNGTWADSTNYASSPATVGAQHSNKDSYFIGYLDEIRITKGVGRYTSAFKYPTAPFPIG